MVVQHELLNKCKDFGLNTYESKLWIALLSRGVSTAGELSDIASVPRSRSYDVLESLEKKGFIVMKLGKPIKYIAVSPTEVLERVKQKVKEDSENQIKLLKGLDSSDVLKELSLLHSQGVDLIDPTDLSGSVRGRNNVYNHIDSMIKNAQESVIITTSKTGFIRKTESLKNSIQQAHKKGVKVRIAAPLSKETEEAVDKISPFAEVKHSNIDARFICVDNKQMFFMLMDDNEVHSSYDTAVWVNTPYFTSSVSKMFDAEWQKMK